MSFIRYPHLVKYGGQGVENIEFGTCHIFPKLDGTNASVWFHNGRVRAGSRNRELDTVNFEQDNAGFAKWVYDNEGRFLNALQDNPQCIIYGEWLVPHTIKHYRKDAWRKFYVFDVFDTIENRFWKYTEYKGWLEEYGIDYLPCVKIIKNGSWDNFIQEARNCKYLLTEDDTTDKLGEGIVIKNYDWLNKNNQQVWAKIVNAEFKENNLKAFGAPILENKAGAQAVCEIACTDALIEKEYAKITNETGAFEKRLIPRLLHTVYYSVVTEELWDCLKKINYTSVNFKELQALCIQRVKQVKPELFQ